MKNYHKPLGKFFSDHIVRQIRINNARRKDAVEAEPKKYKERFDAFSKLVETKRQYEALKEHFRKRVTFEEDFERLLAMQGVRKVTVNLTDRMLIVETRRLFLESASDSRVFYDIGQKRIRIKFSKEPSRLNDISFEDGFYSGTHQHAHARDKGTCFGSEYNDAVDKFLQEGLVVPLMHFLLSFLQREISPPTARLPHELGSEYSPDVEREYATPLERAEMKERYAALMEEVMLDLMSRTTVKDIAQYEQEYENLSQQWRGIRNTILNMQALIETQNALLKEIEPHLNQQVKAIQQTDGLQNIEYADAMLRISFTTKTGASFVLEVSEGNKFEIRQTTVNGFPVGAYMGTSAPAIPISDRDREAGLECLASGDIAELLDVAIKAMKRRDRQ